MARPTHANPPKKAELLALANKLFSSKGYEKTTVEEILTLAGCSKGAFYHYFSSKDALLDALVGETTNQIFALLETIIKDSAQDTLEKLRRISRSATDIKVANRAILKEYLQLLYRPENAVIRYKFDSETVLRAVPLYAGLIAQGVTEGVFSVPDPAFAAAMMFSMGAGLRDLYWQQFCSIDDAPESMDTIEKYMYLYENALERLLGAAPGSLQLVAPDTIRRFRQEEPHEHA